MPLSPYAKILVSVNGGANASGGIDVPSAAAIALSGESTVGWRQQRWEIYDYPEGWATPAGWSTDANGVIYSTDVTPTSFTLPANTSLWGGWGLRLKINEQVSDDQDVIPNLLDETTSLMMLSPKGQRDIVALEEGQFCTTTTAIKQWVRSYQRNLRTIETLLPTPASSLVESKSANAAFDTVGQHFRGTAAGIVFTLPAAPSNGDWYEASNGAAGTISVDGNGHGFGGVATTYNLDQLESLVFRYDATDGVWIISASANTPSEVTTTDASHAGRVARFAVGAPGVVVARVLVKVESANGNVNGAWEIKASYYRSLGGAYALTAGEGPTVTNLWKSDAGLDVTVDPNGDTDFDVNVHGLAATTLTWRAAQMSI